jgi:peptidoglycan/LPS O-acetylase OafA/YrhL
MRPLIAAPIDEATLDGRNNFHLLRLVAALLVLLAHAFHLLGRAAEEPVGRWFARLDASLLGVAVFFVLSGFLVSRSWDRRGDLADFLLARALRITPALWAVLLVTVLVLGPVATTLPASAYLSSRDTLAYLLSNLFLHTQYLLPGVFESNPVPGVNGSLWTIPLEVVLYIVLGICGWLGVLAAPLRTASILSRAARHPIAAAALLLLAALLVSKILRTGPQYYGLAGYFVLGALCYRFRHALALRLDLTLALVVLMVLGARTALEPIVTPLAIVTTVLALALHPAFRMQPTWLHRHDYSYGTYLYGFPAQQSLIALGATDPWALFGCAMLVTLACAALSWHLIERPCLELKPRAFLVSSRIRLFRARSP